MSDELKEALLNCNVADEALSKIKIDDEFVQNALGGIFEQIEELKSLLNQM